MTKLFEGERIVPVWTEAVRALIDTEGRTARNYVLDISLPTRLVAADLEVIKAVNAQVRAAKDGLSTDTVAGTLFPNGLYRRFGRPEFYGRYISAMRKGKDIGTWGTYALRMIERKDPKTSLSFNPLDQIVRKLRSAKDGRRIQAAYELGVTALEDLDSEVHADAWCELPIYDPATDRGRPTNNPCLSHLSFKLNDDDTIDLTAMYRSHHYAQRALGNLIGLSQLLSFVAKESTLKVGALTCISTSAHLDVTTWGGVAGARALIAKFP